MRTSIHARLIKDRMRYRMYNESSDQYDTAVLTESELHDFLRSEDVEAGLSVADFEREYAQRLKRADFKGTSDFVSPLADLHGDWVVYDPEDSTELPAPDPLEAAMACRGTLTPEDCTKIAACVSSVGLGLACSLLLSHGIDDPRAFFGERGLSI